MTTQRTVLRVPMRPIAGSRFQPTGFPDLGPATFQRPMADGSTQQCVLVESNQSMANRLEGTLWSEGEQAPLNLISDLPWVRVTAADDGRYVTSSRTEAHRLASAFVKQSTLDGVGMTEVIKERLELRDDTPLAPRQIARAIFALDPLCLVHGVFFADSAWPGQPKVSRAITGVVEAHDVAEAVSGGVKFDRVRHSLGESEGGTAEGYGTVPFHRMEFTAREIEATFVLDLAQLGAYGLPDGARDLLEALALWEVRSLIEGGMRLRTACDLEPVDSSALDASLPEAAELEDRIGTGIASSADLMPTKGAIDVIWSGGKAKKPKGDK